jgi:hypothetical protein
MPDLSELRRLVATVIAALICTVSSAHAQSRPPSPCTFDAITLCGATQLDIANPARVIACLKKNATKLTPACRQSIGAKP